MENMQSCLVVARERKKELDGEHLQVIWKKERKKGRQFQNKNETKKGNQNEMASPPPYRDRRRRAHMTGFPSRRTPIP